MRLGSAGGMRSMPTGMLGFRGGRGGGRGGVRGGNGMQINGMAMRSKAAAAPSFGKASVKSMEKSYKLNTLSMSKGLG